MLGKPIGEMFYDSNMRTVDIRKGLGFDSFIFRREQLAQHP
jgi:hypothetical protein